MESGVANLLHVLAIILAGFAVGVADALIKKASEQGGFVEAIKSGWMLPILLLYLAQVVFFIYVFVNRWQLGVVGIFQMAVYAITVLALGFFMFKESPSAIQLAGMALALVGVFLMNI